MADALDTLRACVLVDDALHRRNLGQRLDIRSLRRYVLYQHTYTQWALRLAVVLNLSLVVFEAPALVPLPAGLLLAVEAATLAVFAGQLYWVSSFVEVNRRLSSDPKHVGLAGVLLLTVLDMAGSLVYGFRLTRVLRVYFISYNSKFIRSAIRDIRITIPAVLDVVVLLFFFIAVYSVFCTVLFLPLQDDVGYFRSFWAGFLSMYVLRTTANFPDVMMPFYAQNRLASLVFVIFLCIATYLLTSLVLAVIYNKYRLHMKVEEASALRKQRKALAHAFRLLDTSARGAIDVNQWCSLFAHLRPSWSAAKVHLLFRVLSHDSPLLHRHQFFAIVQLLNLSIETEAVKARPLWAPASASASASVLDALLAPSASHVDRARSFSTTSGTFAGSPYASTVAPGASRTAMDTFRAVVQSRLFAYVVDALIVLNVVLVAIEVSSSDPNGVPTRERDAELAFTVIFVVEAACKLTALGPQVYFDDGWNRFDFLLVALTMIDIITSLASSAAYTNVFRYLLLLRVIRLWTTMGEIKRYRVLMSTLWQLLPALATYAAIQFMLFYVYAVVGMELFGGLIYEGNPRLAGTVFADTGYFLNSFNDVFYAYVTLFELMVINNWHVIADGYAAATGTQLSWLYFISFSVTAALFIINIVVAFILEAFIIQWELNEARSRSPLEDDVIHYALSHHAYMRSLGQGGVGSEHEVAWQVKANHNITYFLQHMFAAELAAEEEAGEIFVVPPSLNADLALLHSTT